MKDPRLKTFSAKKDIILMLMAKFDIKPKEVRAFVNGKEVK